ncbi:MAG: ABC transporter ATP-binding protein [Chlamydiota bacterium]
MFDKSIMSLLSRREKKVFIGLAVAMLLFSFVEALGLGLIIPYINILQNYKEGIQNPHFLAVLNALHFPSQGLEMVVGFSVFFIVAFTLRALSQIVLEYYSAKFSYSLIDKKATQLHAHYLSMSYCDFLKRNSNHLIKNCTSTAEAAARGIYSYLQFIASLMVITILLVLMLAVSSLSSLMVVGGFGLISYLICYILKKKNIQEGRRAEYFLRGVYKDSSESFMLFKEIKVANIAKVFSNKFKEKLASFVASRQKTTFYPQIPGVLFEYLAVFLLLSVVVVYLLLGHPIEQLISPLFFYAAIGKRLIPSLNKVTNSQGVFYAMKPSIDLIAEELQSAKPNLDEAPPTLSFKHSLQINNLHFAYEPGKPILQDVSFVMEKNKSTALVGSSGSGKSTLVDIVISLLEPQAGEFFVDGKKVPDFQGLQKKIGYVSQIISLKDDTIAQNIVLSGEAIDYERLNKVLKMAHLEEFVDSLEKGVETVVGERGIMISGGQRQRIGIARALYHDPEILIFDEATSALDNISERIVTQAIYELSGTKTVLAIAHRLSTIQHCDSIYVLEHGKVVARGTHNELLESSPEYCEMNAVIEPVKLEPALN